MQRFICEDVNHSTASKRKLDTWKFMSNNCFNELQHMIQWTMQTFKLML